MNRWLFAGTGLTFRIHLLDVLKKKINLRYQRMGVGINSPIPQLHQDKNIMKVNFFIIGQPKTGTSSLYIYLKNHPDIYIPEQKQLFHFAVDHNRHRQKFKKMNNSLYQNYYNYSFIDYIKKFNFSSERSIYGDVTPDYFYSKDAPNEIYKYNPNAKLIAILRDPISFLLSMHTQLINSNYEKETDFKKALALERKREKEIIKQNPVCPDIFFQYSTLINYKIYIENYYSVFKNNFKIIIYEDFKKDNFKYIDLIAKFLKIKPIIPDKPEIYNISRTVKKDLIYRLKFFYPIRYINNLIPIKLKKTIKNIFEYYVMDSNPKKNNQLVDTDLIYLKKTFKPKVKLLNDYLSKNSKIFLDKEIDLVEYWDY